MTIDELLTRVLAIFPEATIGQDNDGQIVVYTNLEMEEDLDGERLVSMGELFDDESAT